MAPINTGLWTLAAPSTALYERGLAVLEGATWNASHGLNGAGTPRELVARAEALGLPWRRRMRRTRFLKHNTVRAQANCSLAPMTLDTESRAPRLTSVPFLGSGTSSPAIATRASFSTCSTST